MDYNIVTPDLKNLFMKFVDTENEISPEDLMKCIKKQNCFLNISDSNMFKPIITHRTKMSTSFKFLLCLPSKGKRFKFRYTKELLFLLVFCLFCKLEYVAPYYKVL